MRAEKGYNGRFLGGKWYTNRCLTSRDGIKGESGAWKINDDGFIVSRLGIFIRCV